MPLELIILIASLLVSWLVFNWAFKVLKASVGTAISIAAIVLAMQLLFGIGPNQLFQHITHLPDTLGKIIFGR
jgi:type IV secretory pathway TrbL component